MGRPISENPFHSYSCMLHEDMMKRLCGITKTTIHRDALQKAVEYIIRKGGK